MIIYCKCNQCGCFFSLGTGGRKTKRARMFCDDRCRMQYKRQSETTRVLRSNGHVRGKFSANLLKQCILCDRWLDRIRNFYITSRTVEGQIRSEYCRDCDPMTFERGGTVKWKDVYDRDRGICYLCSYEVKRPLEREVGKKQKLSDEYAVANHIIPLAFGGRDDRSNVRLAHAWCDWKKHTLNATDAKRLIQTGAFGQIPDFITGKISLNKLNDT